MSQALELYYEVRKRKLNISVCNIPRSVDNDIPIIDESFGYQSCVDVINNYSFMSHNFTIF